MRSEFPQRVKVAAFSRASGRCEGVRDNGERCPVKLTVGKYHYDHVIPDGLYGEPTLENCAVLCLGCHAVKTGKKDVPAIAKAKRVEARHIGATKKRPWNTKWRRKMDGTTVLRKAT